MNEQDAAQLAKLKEEENALVTKTSSSGTSYRTDWSSEDAISCLVLTFGIVTLAIAAYLIRAEKSSNNVLRVIGTILILNLAVFLIVAGYSDRQIAPAMGLLGTVAGYLLGKEQSPSEGGQK